MTDAVEEVLRLVAEGRLSAEEAEPILAALEATSGPAEASYTEEPIRSDQAGRMARIEVTEHGRSVVNLRVPLGLGRMALAAVPGLLPANIERIREAVARGLTGPILQVQDEDGDGVRIVIE